MSGFGEKSLSVKHLACCVFPHKQHAFYPTALLKVGSFCGLCLEHAHAWLRTAATLSQLLQSLPYSQASLHLQYVYCDQDCNIRFLNKLYVSWLVQENAGSG